MTSRGTCAAGSSVEFRSSQGGTGGRRRIPRACSLWGQPGVHVRETRLVLVLRPVDPAPRVPERRRPGCGWDTGRSGASSSCGQLGFPGWGSGRGSRGFAGPPLAPGRSTPAGPCQPCYCASGPPPKAWGPASPRAGRRTPEGTLSLRGQGQVAKGSMSSCLWVTVLPAGAEMAGTFLR